MVDVTDARARPSRTSRSRGPGIDTGSSRVRSQDFRRQIDVSSGKLGEAAALDTVGASLGAFFPGLQQRQATEQQRTLDEIQKENNELAILASNTAHQRPKEFQNALETGDWSAFPAVGTDAQRRRAFVDTGKAVVGGIQGSDMAPSSLRPSLRVPTRSSLPRSPRSS
jgi:hypothetical protein